MAKRRDEIILGLDAGPYIRGLAKAATSTKAFVKELDTADSRMSNLTQGALALGPALVPIGATAVPAVAALTTGLGAAAGAAAVAALAFNGVGDGLKALNDYQLEPSAENLAKVKQAFEEIGPAGANFVLFLDEIEPKLDKLQNTARAGLLPGVEEGIRSLLDRGPQVNRIIGEISGALGDLASEGGEALSSDRFDDFFNYIENEARPILMDMGRTLGNVAEGLSNMLVGFGPMTSDFSDGMLQMSRDFAKWTRGLENNESFQEFVQYVQRVGPEVMETFGAVALAIADIVEAAAPVGEATLPVIKALAEVLGTIANSQVGPVLIGAAAGISALSRAVAVGKAANITALAGSLKKSREEGGKLGKTADTLKGKLSGAGGLAGVAGLTALSFTDLDESLGVSNTAMGAMIGAIGGVPGAILGGTIGAVIDFTNRNDDLAASLQAVERAADNPENLRAWAKAVNNALSDTRDALDKATNVDNFGSFTSPAEAWGFGVETITNDLEEAADKARENQREFLAYKQVLSELRGYVLAKGGDTFSHMTNDLVKLKRFSRDAIPALRRAGISIKDLQGSPNPALWDRAVGVIKNYHRTTDSLPGRIDGVRDALRGLENPLLSAAESADELDAALSSLLDPQLNAREALIDWKQGLVDLRKEISRTNGTLDLNTKAGRANQSAIIDRIRKLQDVAVTQARVDGNTKRATKTLREGRKAIIQAGIESGISADDMRRLVNQMGLVPKVVAPKVKVEGTKKAKDDLKNVDKWARDVLDAVTIFTDAPGSEQTKDDLKVVDSWAHRVKDRVDVKTDAPGAREAKGDLEGVDNAERGIADKHEVKTSAPGAEGARAAFVDLDKAIRGVDGKKVKVTLETKAEKILDRVTNAFADLFADGGLVEAYADGGTRESHIAQIARPGAWRVWAEPETGGEAYIPLAASKRKRSLDIWRETGSRLGVEGFADGGVRIPTRGNDPMVPLGRIDRMFDEIVAQMSKGVSKYMNEQIMSLQTGFHYPLPRQYGWTGSWGSYESGGSHPALDFPAPLGTPIYSVLPGRVMHTTSLGDSYGNYTEVRHGPRLSSLYAHQQRFGTKPGAKVMAGETIGFVNSTGNSSGNHLHLEMQRGGSSFDYTRWLTGGGPMGLALGDMDFSGDLNRASPSQAQAYARSIMGRYGWGAFQWPYWEDLGYRESGWRWNATNPSSGAYGIPQSLPPEKMAAAGPDWRTNAGTQLDWMAGYIADRYGGPYGAIQWHNANNWYKDGGINVFDNGGIWPSGTLGVNLSGRDEYVNDPQTTAAAMHMADGGILAMRNGGLLETIHKLIDPSLRPGTQTPDLISRHERRLERIQDRIERARERQQKNREWVRNAERRLKEAEGKNEKQEARARLRAAKQHLDASQQREDRAKKDRDQAREDLRQAKQDQKTLDRSVKKFNFNTNKDGSDIRQEMRDLIQGVREAMGKDSGLFKALKRMQDRVRDVSKALDKERRERDKVRDQLKELRQKRNDYANTVQDNFRNDLFSGGLDQFELQAEADRNDARSTRKALQRARRKGLSGGLYKQLAASGNMELAQQFGRLDRQEIRRYERLFAQRQRASDRLGDMAATEVYGKAIRRQTNTLERVDRSVQKLEHRLEKFEDRVGNRVERGARRGTREGNEHRRKRLHQMSKEHRG